MRVQCNCGKALKVGDHLAGKQIRCPACGESLLAEELVEVTELAEPVKRKGKSRPEPEEEDDEEERPQPKSKKKRKSETSVLGRYGLLIGFVVGAAPGVVAVIVILILNGRPNDNAAMASGSNKAPSESKPGDPVGGNRPPITWTSKDGTLDKRPPVSDLNRPPQVKPTENPFAGPPDMKMPVDSLGFDLENYGIDTVRTRYKGKVIELTGVVKGMYKDRFGYDTAYIDFKWANRNRGIRVATTDLKAWTKVFPGQTIKIKARLPEPPSPNGLELEGGSILEVTGKPVPFMTAEQVGKDFEPNPEGVALKYLYSEVGDLLITGEIIDVNVDRSDNYRVSLKTGSSVSIQIKTDPESARDLKPGMKIKALGAFTGFETKDRKLILLENGLIIETLK